MIPVDCIFCNTPIPEGRLKALPGTKTCVNCSTASPKKGIPVVLGSGDHTCNELMIVEDKDYRKISKIQTQQKFNTSKMPITNDLDEEGLEVSSLTKYQHYLRTPDTEIDTPSEF